MNLPQILLDQLQKKSGIISLSSGRESSPAAFLKSLSEKIVQDSRRSLIIQREDLRKDQVGQKVSVLNYNQLGTTPVRELLLRSDIVLMEDVITLEELELALYLAEAGSLVVVHWLSRSVMMTLQRVLSWLAPHQRDPVFWRWGEVAHFFGSMHSLRGQDGSDLKAWEVCLMNSEMRGLLKSGHIKEFEGMLTTSTQAPAGTVSLNQSLLQLLIQRKIDIKSAFEASLDPADLDQLMKKVGI